MNKAVVRFGVVFIVVFMLLGAFERGLGQDAIGTGQFPSIATRYDFDGDRKSDISIFRPSSGDWWYRRSSDSSAFASRFGLSSDRIAAADYDADGKTDIAVYRDGVWYRLSSLNGTVHVSNFGVATDQPLPADFDGDGKADTTVFRQSNGTWHILQSGSGQYVSFQFGSGGDVPLVGDYDGDGKSDPTIFRPSHGTWYRLNSSDGSTFTQNFGLAGDTPVRGDFDGDGRFDLAVWRPLNGTWYVQRSSDGGFMIRQFGLAGDVPVASDYDGDGSDDLSVFRPTGGVWYRINSSNGTFQSLQFGLGSDLPVPGQGIENAQPTPTPTVTPTPSPTATPTPSPTATPTPTPTPSPSFTCDYYASPTGTSSGSGSSSSPWNLQTALNKTSLIRNGKNLCMRGGVYKGKFISTLNGGGIVRSAPGEWATVDGNWSTTLSTSISANQTSLTVADASVLLPTNGGDEISIDGEILKFCQKSGNTLSSCGRGNSGSVSGAQPHSAGAIVSQAGNQLYITGDNTTYRDFEITNSRSARVETVYPELARGAGVFNVGNGNNFINLVVHDNVNGIFTGSSSDNTLLYGVISYNNGMLNSAGDPLGHGFYLENASGYSRVYDSMTLNAFNLGMQGYGVTGPYVGGDLQGSIFVNAGGPLGQHHWNLVYGPDSVASPTATINECHFYHQPSTSSYQVSFGYGAGVSSGSVTNNYFFGSGTQFVVGTVSNLTYTGNRHFSTGGSDRYTLSPTGRGYTWNNNTYYNTTSQARFGDTTAVEDRTFAAWRTSSGYDSASTATSARLSDAVIVRPNAYSQGSANIIIYSPSGATTASVNLSGAGLANGQSFTIRNAFNYFGPEVASGVFNASSPVLNLTLAGAAATVARPIGMTTTPATSCPNLCVLVVKPN